MPAGTAARPGVFVDDSGFEITEVEPHRQLAVAVEVGGVSAPGRSRRGIAEDRDAQDLALVSLHESIRDILNG